MTARKRLTFNCQTANSRQRHPPSLVELRRAKSPLFLVRPGAAGRLLPSLPRKGVRNDWAKIRARGARMFLACGHPYAVSRRHTDKEWPSVKLNRPWTQFFACVPHAMAFSVCSMSPGVVTSADFARFVRTVARTFTWTVRPCYRRLFLRYLGALPLASKDRHRGEPPHPAPRSKDGSNAPSHRSGTIG